MIEQVISKDVRIEIFAWSARVDSETKAAITKIATTVDALSGMIAGCAAYIAAIDGAHHVDRRRAVGSTTRLLPEGLAGDPQRAGLVAKAMIEEIARLAREIQDVKQRARATEPHPLSRDWTGRPAELNPALDSRK